MPTKTLAVMFTLLTVVATLIIACNKNQTQLSGENTVAKYLTLPTSPFNYANQALPAYLTAQPIKDRSTHRPITRSQIGEQRWAVSYSMIKHFQKTELSPVPAVINKRMHFQILKS